MVTEQHKQKAFESRILIYFIKITAGQVTDKQLNKCKWGKDNEME